MKLIDLSQIINNQTPAYPGDTSPVITTAKGDGHTSSRLSSGFHVATHLDMPMHFTDDARFCADFPIDSFAGPGVLLDVRGESPIGMKPHYDQLIQPGTIVLLYTGHDQYFNSDPDKYYKQYPQITMEFAQFLTDRRIKMLGMDTCSPDYAPHDVHKLMFPADIFMLENLTNLAALLDIGPFEVFALPLKVEAEASFVRAFARPTRQVQ